MLAFGFRLVRDDEPFTVDAYSSRSVEQAIRTARARVGCGILSFDEPKLPDDFRMTAG